MKIVASNDNMLVSVANEDSSKKRSFSYALNVKRANAKLLRGIIRTKHLDIEVKYNMKKLTKIVFKSCNSILEPILSVIN